MLRHWQCHCCLEENQEDRCRRCGRLKSYLRDHASNPLLSTEVVKAMRVEQLMAYFDKFETNLAGPGGPINEADDFGFTSVHVAAGVNAAILRKLLDFGGLVEAREKGHGWRPLHVAAFHGSKETTAVLLEKGARVDVVTTLKQTPLHLATDAGVAKLLLRRSNDLAEMKDKRGRRPIHSASALGYIGVVQELLEVSGPDALDWLDDENFRPEALAEYAGHSDIVDLCRNAEMQAKGKLSLREELKLRAGRRPWHSQFWDDSKRQFQERKSDFQMQQRCLVPLIAKENDAILRLQTQDRCDRYNNLKTQHWRDRKRHFQQLLDRSWGSSSEDDNTDLLLQSEAAEWRTDTLRSQSSSSEMTTSHVVILPRTEATMPNSGAPLYDEYLENRRAVAASPFLPPAQRGVYARYSS